MSAKPKPNIAERRREALLIATRLQRRNVAARWDQLRDNRVVGWVESAKALSDAMRGSPVLRGGAGSLAAIGSSALWGLRERSGWGLLAVAAKWWLRRRTRRSIEAAARPGRKFFFSRARRAR